MCARSIKTKSCPVFDADQIRQVFVACFNQVLEFLHSGHKGKKIEDKVIYVDI